MKSHNSVADGLKGTYNDTSLPLAQRFKLVPLATKQSLFDNIFKDKMLEISPFNGKAIMLEYLYQKDELVDKYKASYRIKQDTLQQVSNILAQEGVNTKL